MTDFTTLLQQGNAWFFIPGAVLLGALHGLEPGHSKTMMAAFIIAIKGTARQAAMLGLAATLSHTAIVWLIAFGGMYISNRFTAESAEPWLQLISAIIILRHRRLDVLPNLEGRKRLAGRPTGERTGIIMMNQN